MMQLSLLEPPPTAIALTDPTAIAPSAPLNPTLTFTEVHCITTADAIASNHPLLPTAYREWRWFPLLGRWGATGSMSINPKLGQPDGVWFPCDFDPRVAQRLPDPEPSPIVVAPGLQVGDWVVRSNPLTLAGKQGERRDFYPFNNAPGRITQIVGAMAWVEHKPDIPPYPHRLQDLEIGDADDDW